MEKIAIEDIQPRYLWLDPASGKRQLKIKSVRARSAIAVVGTSVDTRIWVLDCWAGRVGSEQVAQQFVEMCIKWGPTIAAYEDAGQQSLLEDPINSAANRMNVVIPLAAVKAPTKVDKNWRIRQILQPLNGAGRLMIPREFIELRNEITSFPMSTMKDMIDALASACGLVPPPVSMIQKSDDVAELARYMRETGSPVRDIEDAVRNAGGYNVTDNVPTWQRRLLQKGAVTLRR